MKGRGGSGDGRVAFARVYSGTLRSRDSVRVISPSNIGSLNDDSEGKSNSNKTLKHPVERIGGMLELSGGQFGNLPEGSCHAGDVCALVGLKKVVTGDTILSTTVDGVNGDNESTKKSTKKKKNNDVHKYEAIHGWRPPGWADKSKTRPDTSRRSLLDIRAVSSLNCTCLTRCRGSEPSC